MTETLYPRGRGGKWTALIDSWRALRSRLTDFYDAPDLSAIDAELERLRALRWEWIEEQRARATRRKAA